MKLKPLFEGNECLICPLNGQHSLLLPGFLPGGNERGSSSWACTVRCLLVPGRGTVGLNFHSAREYCYGKKLKVDRLEDKLNTRCSNILVIISESYSVL